jgi:hypothetical protein
VTSAQTRAVEYHECLAVERQVGARQPGKTNAFCVERLQESRSLELAGVELLAGPARVVYGFGFQQAAFQLGVKLVLAESGFFGEFFSILCRGGGWHIRRGHMHRGRGGRTECGNPVPKIFPCCGRCAALRRMRRRHMTQAELGAAPGFSVEPSA